MFQFPAFASYPYVFESKIPYHNAWKPRPFVKTDWIFQAFKVGCPIRRSMDQSLFAAPHGFSQRITSFFACACQGIHQMPLRHLIVLIANAHPYGKPKGTSQQDRNPTASCPIPHQIRLPFTTRLFQMPSTCSIRSLYWSYAEQLACAGS